MIHQFVQQITEKKYKPYDIRNPHKANHPYPALGGGETGVLSSYPIDKAGLTHLAQTAIAIKNSTSRARFGSTPSTIEKDLALRDKQFIFRCNHPKVPNVSTTAYRSSFSAFPTSSNTEFGEEGVMKTTLFINSFELQRYITIDGQLEENFDPKDTAYHLRQEARAVCFGEVARVNETTEGMTEDQKERILDYHAREDRYRNAYNKPAGDPAWDVDKASSLYAAINKETVESRESFYVSKGDMIYPVVPWFDKHKYTPIADQRYNRLRYQYYREGDVNFLHERSAEEYLAYLAPKLDTHKNDYVVDAKVFISKYQLEIRGYDFLDGGGMPGDVFQDSALGDFMKDVGGPSGGIDNDKNGLSKKVDSVHDLYSQYGFGDDLPPIGVGPTFRQTRGAKQLIPNWFNESTEQWNDYQKLLSIDPENNALVLQWRKRVSGPCELRAALVQQLQDVWRSVPTEGRITGDIKDEINQLLHEIRVGDDIRPPQATKMLWVLNGNEGSIRCHFGGSLHAMYVVTI